jgi:hypothetical protein
VLKIEHRGLCAAVTTTVNRRRLKPELQQCASRLNDDLGVARSPTICDDTLTYGFSICQSAAALCRTDPAT